jgi:hypothetical protein
MKSAPDRMDYANVVLSHEIIPWSDSYHFSVDLFSYEGRTLIIGLTHDKFGTNLSGSLTRAN